jgi:hypothetical protein
MLILLKKKKNITIRLNRFYLLTYVRDFSFILFCIYLLLIYIYFTKLMICATRINGDGFMDLMTANLVMVSLTVMLVSTVGLSAPSTTQ